jgi:hypothetical protein
VTLPSHVNHDDERQKESKVNDQNDRRTRVRHIATGAIAALGAVGAITGAGALAAKPHANTHRQASLASASKTPMSPAPGKTHTSQPNSDQPFLDAIQRLVNDGTLTPAQGEVLGRDIRAGRIDTDTLGSSGLTSSQVQAVEQALADAKRALAARVTGPSPAAKRTTGEAGK